MQCLKSKLSKKSCHLIEFLIMTWEREKRKAEKKEAENPGHGLQIKKLTFTTHLSFSFSLLLPSLLYSLRLCNWIKVGASLRPGASLMQRLLWVQVFYGAEAFLRLGLPCCRGFPEGGAPASEGAPAFAYLPTCLAWNGVKWREMAWNGVKWRSSPASCVGAQKRVRKRPKKADEKQLDKWLNAKINRVTC